MGQSGSRAPEVGISAGVAYFGNRILRHVAADMADLAERGFSGVLHTFSENDLVYYRDHMKRIVEVSHAAGLEVQISPWGLGYVFGGEAESRFGALHPESCQVLDDGAPTTAGCPNQPRLREFARRWASAAIETGADCVFWDEPHWVYPPLFGASRERWGCRCARCRALFQERFGKEMPAELTAEVAAFREESLTDFVREMVAHAAAGGARNTVCLLPEGGSGIADWTTVASAPGLDTLATTPYWRHFGHPAGEFVGEISGRTRDLSDEHGVVAQVWIQGFGLDPEDAGDIHAAARAAREAGVTDLWTWGYEACGHMSYLGTREPDKVWKALIEALVGARVDRA